MWWSHQCSGSLHNTACKALQASVQLLSVFPCLQRAYTDFHLCVNSHSYSGRSLSHLLTCDHGPAVHTGGQLCVLQACLLAGVGWVQRESARASTLVWLVLWSHWTCRVCSPPPQLRLHTPHSPTDQLGQHNTSPLSQHAQLLNHLFRQACGNSPMTQ